MSDATKAASAARRIDDTMYEIGPDFRSDMKVPARIYADEELWEQIATDRSLGQLVNVATLPGVTQAAYAMPDAHEGYGFPVGGVAAFDAEEGIISPGGVGYDINCGVRMLVSDLHVDDLGDRLEPLVHALGRAIPSGMGPGGRFSLNDAELDRVLSEGCGYLVERGMATRDDVAHTEAGGCLPGADPSRVSDRARDRGRGQLGSMGSGNHFVEVERVSGIFDDDAAEALGLDLDTVVLLIHTGSRGFGHQVCTDYVKRMDREMPRLGIDLPDRQLACAPLSSEPGRAYLGAMAAAANYAWCNRQVISHVAREVFQDVVASHAELRLLYDVAHNIAKIEEHDGGRLCVHRKGATRALGPSHPETPEAYRSVGQPVFIPDGHGLVRPGRRGRVHGALVRQRVPRGGTSDEPGCGPEAPARTRGPPCPHRARHRGARSVHEGARRGGPGGLQGRRSRGGGRRALRARPPRRAHRRAGRHQGLSAAAVRGSLVRPAPRSSRPPPPASPAKPASAVAPAWSSCRPSSRRRSLRRRRAGPRGP